MYAILTPFYAQDFSSRLQTTMCTQHATQARKRAAPDMAVLSQGAIRFIRKLLIELMRVNLGLPAQIALIFDQLGMTSDTATPEFLTSQIEELC